MRRTLECGYSQAAGRLSMRQWRSKWSLGWLNRNLQGSEGVRSCCSAPPGNGLGHAWVNAENPHPQRRAQLACLAAGTADATDQRRLRRQVDHLGTSLPAFLRKVVLEAAGDSRTRARATAKPGQFGRSAAAAISCADDAAVPNRHFHHFPAGTCAPLSNAFAPPPNTRAASCCDSPGIIIHARRPASPLFTEFYSA
jgi:hypothetical protein